MGRTKLLAVFAGLALFATGCVEAAVSIDSSGQTFGQVWKSPAISQDGRYVAFASNADNVIPGDTNDKTDVFLADTETDEVVLISIGTAGATSDGHSGAPSISADGRYVAFQSWANNMVPGDSDYDIDTFRHDTVTGETIQVSVATVTGENSNGPGLAPSISADGNLVTWLDWSNNLVAEVDDNYERDIFVRDIAAGTTIRVNVNAAGEQSNMPQHGAPEISADGTVVVFSAQATNLVPNDTNGSADIFAADLTSGTLSRVSVDASGAEANGSSFVPTLSADGSVVVFQSHATNLVGSDTNGVQDIFAVTPATGAVERVSVADSGAELNGESVYADVSDDGNRISFESAATNAVSDPDTNGFPDAFARDRGLAQTRRLSENFDGEIGTNPSWQPTVSGDGLKFAFTSGSQNFVDYDSNNSSDVFTARWRE